MTITCTQSIVEYSFRGKLPCEKGRYYFLLSHWRDGNYFIILTALLTDEKNNYARCKNDFVEEMTIKCTQSIVESSSRRQNFLSRKEGSFRERNIPFAI